MIFSSLLYVAIFLPSAIIGYFFSQRQVGHKAAIAFLVLVSWVFYAYWKPIYLPVLLFSISFNYIIAIFLRRNKSKACLWVGIAANLLLLGYFKYFDFFVENVNFIAGTTWPILSLVLPLGISFHTFQQIAYLVDTYKGKTTNDSFLNYSLFVSFFPQLIAGPIVHWREMMPQFEDAEKRAFTTDNFVNGLNIFLLGFFKKVFIADILAKMSDPLFANTANLTVAEAWIAALGFMLRIYFDFSAYSEMAIGSALMMNIKLPINFNSPYKVKNINEFWSRWHITLMRWFFQYVFIPLMALWSKKRAGEPASTDKNLMVLIAVTCFVFALSGLWHGAAWTFVIWGALHGMALSVYRVWTAREFEMPAAMAKTLTFFFLLFASAVFRLNSLGDLCQFFSALFGGHGLIVQDPEKLKDIYYGVLILIVPVYITFCTPNTLEIVGYDRIRREQLPWPARLLKFSGSSYAPVTCGIFFALALLKVITADNSPFIYFAF